jgi:hypothetical protein
MRRRRLETGRGRETVGRVEFFAALPEGVAPRRGKLAVIRGGFRKAVGEYVKERR